MRLVTSIVSESLKTAGARRSKLSSRSPTSALLREGRLVEPAKMTSSMPEARMFLNELSPITQRRASTRFDLPQPFGPTTPVKPASILNSALSQKLLKPVRRRRSNFIAATLRSGRLRAVSPARAPSSRQPSRSRIAIAGRMSRFSRHNGIAQSTPAAEKPVRKRERRSGRREGAGQAEALDSRPPLRYEPRLNSQQRAEALAEAFPVPGVTAGVKRT